MTILSEQHSMQTSEQITYHRLKKLIINNGLPHGQFLSQRKLADSVGATLVTLRSSLRLLENDGLLENVPKWGVRIPLETETKVKERYYIRELLEVGAVDRFLELNPPNARQLLVEKAELCDTWPKEDGESFCRFAEKHEDFHLSIAKLSSNTMLVQQLTRLSFRSMMLANAKYGWDMLNESAYTSHHRKFVENIFEYERSKALEEVRQHIRRGCSKELVMLGRIKHNEAPNDERWSS